MPIWIRTPKGAMYLCHGIYTFENTAHEKIYLVGIMNGVESDDWAILHELPLTKENVQVMNTIKDNIWCEISQSDSDHPPYFTIANQRD